jgi:hypothetical protein
MAQGFADIQRNTVNKDPGYKTLFERVTEATGGEKKSLSWYRKTVATEALKYKQNFSKYKLEKMVDGSSSAKQQDSNELRKYVVEGHLYMFEYKAKMKWLPYYDTFPLVYVVKSNKSEFWGANLHYISPKRRIQVVKNLMKGRIDIPKRCFHKYLDNHVGGSGYFLDLAISEWDTAILLPTENFIKDINGMKFPLDKKVVWDETDENYYDKIKGTRAIAGYGSKQSREMVK